MSPVRRLFSAAGELGHPEQGIALLLPLSVEKPGKTREYTYKFAFRVEHFSENVHEKLLHTRERST
ncbi:hypothetical protein SBA5_220121 [Candidatus Sulfotelmatomonas gaucii]|uniref:Uncharacterized protein n=1 Tax=Candidatus Sulfuritelmatomonas gaucii TaxID=2043161 RepID=A0A2N9L8G5_9BACT|nr:hypothetical protein SBA5_220121 [Candidatus Sulfotelmatomonas gaucii]